MATTIDKARRERWPL